MKDHEKDLKEVNQSGEDFLHEAKVTIFLYILWQLTARKCDHWSQTCVLQWIIGRFAVSEIDLETQTFKFMRYLSTIFDGV